MLELGLLEGFGVLSWTPDPDVSAIEAERLIVGVKDLLCPKHAGQWSSLELHDSGATFSGLCCDQLTSRLIEALGEGIKRVPSPVVDHLVELVSKTPGLTTYQLGVAAATTGNYEDGGGLYSEIHLALARDARCVGVHPASHIFGETSWWPVGHERFLRKQ